MIIDISYVHKYNCKSYIETRSTLLLLACQKTSDDISTNKLQSLVSSIPSTAIAHIILPSTSLNYTDTTVLIKNLHKNLPHLLEMAGQRLNLIFRAILGMFEFSRGQQSLLLTASQRPEQNRPPLITRRITTTRASSIGITTYPLCNLSQRVDNVVNLLFITRSTFVVETAQPCTLMNTRTISIH